MKFFERRAHEYYTEQRFFWINFRFLNKKGYKLLNNIPNLLDSVKYQVLDSRSKNVYKTPHVYDTKKTIQLLKTGNFSLARFGDGEFMCMQEKNIPFQKSSKKLAERLKQILANNNKKLLVGIPDAFGVTTSDFWNNFISKTRNWLYQYINFNSYYVDACVSRIYGCNPKNIKNSRVLFNELKNIWNNKNVIFVEGEESRLGFGNDLFNNTKSIKRILCPKINAYNVYDKILIACKKQPKNYLFILALGPTATVLADDLSKNGYTALDLGHLDIEYEWMNMKADHIVPVPFKYVNEAKGGQYVKKIQDKIYSSQIIEKITNNS